MVLYISLQTMNVYPEIYDKFCKQKPFVSNNCTNKKKKKKNMEEAVKFIVKSFKDINN